MGIHLTVSYLSLRTLGAELWAFRLPSYLAPALMFFAVILFFRNLGARFIYQIAAVLAIRLALSLVIRHVVAGHFWPDFPPDNHVVVRENRPLFVCGWLRLSPRFTQNSAGLPFIELDNFRLSHLQLVP